MAACTTVKQSLPRHDRGLALVAVLWVIALLGLLAHSMLNESVIAVRAEHNSWIRGVMERDAESGVALALLWLTDTRVSERWRPGAPARLIEFEGAHLSLKIEDELGKIDLNAADDVLLAGLFVSLGVAADEAERLRERIGQRRTTTADKAGTRFERIEELMSVEGIDVDLFRRVAPAVTVYSQARWIDPAVAPFEALVAQPGVDATAAQRLIAARADLPYSPPYQWASHPFLVDVGVKRGGDRLNVRAALRPTPEGRKPYLLLAWTIIGP